MRPTLPPDKLDPCQTAFFLDVDGTLVGIEDSPGDVRLELEVRDLLIALGKVSANGVAIITGRSLPSVDSILRPLKLPTAAEHGLLRRDAQGELHRSPRPAGDVMDRVRERLEAFVAEHDGLLLETKSGSLSLHHRLRPDLAAACAEAVSGAIRGIDGLGIGIGKMVHEARPVAADKGTAVAAFMQEAPFEGRLPFYAGDDVTDEDAIARVNELGGLTVKVGDGETAAQHRFLGRHQFLGWLERAVQ